MTTFTVPIAVKEIMKLKFETYQVVLTFLFYQKDKVASKINENVFIPKLRLRYNKYDAPSSVHCIFFIVWFYIFFFGNGVNWSRTVDFFFKLACL